MRKIAKKLKHLRDKEFVPMILMGLLMLSITWGARFAGIRTLHEPPMGFSAVGAAEKPPIKTLNPNLAPLKIAHRGAKKFAPENTIPAYEKAIELGYDYVELDVRYSRDGVPVIMHDDSMLRTAGRLENVVTLPLKQIKKADAGVWFGQEFAGTPVPTLEECLTAIKGRVKLYLDQKAPPTPELIRILKKYDFYPNNIIVVGGNPLVREFLKLEPDAPVMPYLEKAEEVTPILNEFPTATAINTMCYDLNQEIVDKAHARGVMVFTNVLAMDGDKERSCMKKGLELGADAVQFDNIEVFQSLLAEMKKGISAN